MATLTAGCISEMMHHFYSFTTFLPICSSLKFDDFSFNWESTVELRIETCIDISFMVKSVHVSLRKGRSWAPIFLVNTTRRIYVLSSVRFSVKIYSVYNFLDIKNIINSVSFIIRFLVTVQILDLQGITWLTSLVSF